MRIIPKRLRLLALAAAVGMALANLLAVPVAPAGDLDWLASSKSIPACATPVWPDVAGTTTDVALTSLASSATASGCWYTTCTGNSNMARLYFSPSASLQNQGTADVPWFDWLGSSNAAPLAPYNNRQHPLLTWNLYRIAGNGQIEQIGRGGVKHAWYATNVGCECYGGNILWAGANSGNGSGCSDTYTAGNNNESRRLGPRSEILPKDAVWGRCGSLWDPTCSGVANDHGIGAPAHRMMVRESDLAPALNPGAQYVFEGWYLIRGEDNPDNNFRHAYGSSNWNGSNWSSFNYSGAQVSGPVIEAWAAQPVPPGGAAQIETLVTAEGRVKLAVRVSALGGGFYRYDYALMNLDFARPYTEGAEPNLRVLRNRGFERFAVALADATSLSSIEAADGAGLIPVWTANSVGAEVVFSAATATGTLDWGTLLRFSFVAARPPVPSTATLGVQEPGSPASYSIATLAPGSMFMDGFED